MAEELPLNLVAIDVGRYWNAVLMGRARGKKQSFRMDNRAADFERLPSSTQCWRATIESDCLARNSLALSSASLPLTTVAGALAPSTLPSLLA